MVTGEVEERGDRGDDRADQLAAMIEGDRVGSRVRFTKRYDDVARAYYGIRYEGTLNAEGDEITGEWTIPGVWSGSFIMIRQPERTAEVEHMVGAQAR